MNNKQNKKFEERFDKLASIFGEYKKSDYTETTKMIQDVMSLFVTHTQAVRREEREKFRSRLKEHLESNYHYISRDCLWSFKGNQYHDHFLGNSMALDLENILQSLTQDQE